MKVLAFTNSPSPAMPQCQRTFVAHAEVDYGQACRQHTAYRLKLSDLGVDVRNLAVNQQHPDCVFVEDLAVVLDETVVLAAMGTASRRDEPAGIERELLEYRQVVRLEPPATLEGGDVLRVARTLFVGLSSRTNSAGVTQLERIARPHGYRVVAVNVHGCLHFKTACSALPDGRLLVNPAWLDAAALREFPVLTVPRDDPWAANTLLVDQTVLTADGHDRTAALLHRHGYNVDTVDVSEFAKAEGGVTCLSLMLNQ